MSQVILPSQLVMVRPEYFAFNKQTSLTNLFQANVDNLSEQQVYNAAMAELDAFLATVRRENIDVIVHDTTNGKKTDVSKIDKKMALPDEIFPNCIVTFPGRDIKHLGTIGRSKQKIEEDKTYAILMPMLTENRQREKPSLVQFLKDSDYVVIDDLFPEPLESYESKGMALEGTGALVLDRSHQDAYMAISPRANLELAGLFTDAVGYDLISFNTKKYKGDPVYHTDLLMHVGGQYHNICSSMIADEDKARVLDAARRYRTVHELTEEQFLAFCGNSQPVLNADGQEFLVMSKKAFDAYGPLIKTLERDHKIKVINSPIDIIEQAGGGSGCCLLQEGRHVTL